MKMKASFFERLVAYCIDIIIISAAITVIASFIPNTDTKNLQKELNEINENYVEGQIDIPAYINEMSEIYYQIDQKTMLIAIITVFISMLYFMYYQFKNDGKTLGKKIMKIKIIKRSGKLELNDLVIRSLLVDGILCSMILLLIIFITNENNYFVVKSSIEIIQFLFIATATFMILFRTDKRGAHDIICDTNVISYRNEGKVI